MLYLTVENKTYDNTDTFLCITQRNFYIDHTVKKKDSGTII